MTYDQTHWITKRRKQPLPTFYYHDHFVEMLDFVAAHYAHALLEEHARFISEFRRLSREAQCLYVRLVNRKGRVFSARKLRYPELGDARNLLNELRQAGWASGPSTEHLEDVLSFLTRSEIYDVLQPRFAGLGRSLKKAELSQFVRDNVSADAFIGDLQTDDILVQRRSDAARYLLFLYFGRVQDGLAKFTMRDLGLVRTQDAQDNYEPRFSDRSEALESYFYATRLHDLRSGRSPGVFPSETCDWPMANFSTSAALRNDLAYRLGRMAEKSGDPEQAIDLYILGESAKCSERLIRLLLSAGRKDEAQTHLQRCIDDPRSDEEWLTARDIFERKFEKKRTSMVTDVLRAAATIDIDESQCGAPERAAIDYFEARGQTAFRAENLLWRTLFGLLFWDELYGNNEATTHSPFELLPSALANGSFYETHRDSIEHRLDSLARNPGAIKRELLKTSTRFYGAPNGVFRWRESMNDALFALIDHGDRNAIAEILRRLCQQYSELRYGYPDLMVVDDDGARFVEIKTDGDQLRRNQLTRIRQLRNAGFRADVVRINWVLDPEQTYVVVDVETTGGRGDGHRVTEIGAVKVRDGRVIDRFNTLLNPQRPIPASISRLTGITPGMVADAPYFIDVADDFEEFLSGAIFVAHNVEFDYGFITSEFRRIGRRFRLPKLCTCSSMRKLYPGQRSYSLAALCRSFDIPLKQHHRALCDAEAAAELLLLINERRQAA